MCERPNGAEDYMALTEKYDIFILEGVPVMGYDRRNEAKRFMSMIDVFYDRKKTFYMSAEDIPENIYRGKDHEFEFQRTVSRLNEMLFEDKKII